MSVEENKAIASQFVDVVNRLTSEAQDDGAVDELCSPELARHLKESTVPMVLRTFGKTHRVDITDMIAEGDKVWARVATSGDHVGEFVGIPPTHRKWTNTGVLFFRLEKGRVVEFGGLFDVLSQIQQLGATVTPPQTAG